MNPKPALRTTLWGLAGALSLLLALGFKATPPGAAKGKTAIARTTCYECHDEVKALKEGTKHAKLACEVCHGDLGRHVETSGSEKPSTNLDPALCGGCHKNQYQSFFTTNLEGGARREKGIPAGRSPMQDKLLAGHGFTFEHNEPRGHAFMVIDQFSVDRFQGGAFSSRTAGRVSPRWAAPGRCWKTRAPCSSSQRQPWLEMPPA